MNAYNSSGQVISVSEITPWTSELKEELFYRQGLLDEKKIYIYPAYDPGNSVDITLIRFEY